MLLLAPVLSAGLLGSPAAPFTDVTTYRLAPKTGNADRTGLTNVDSGDAGGDALFGLSNLLLPQLCAIEPSFLWCENEGSLSGGEQWMVRGSQLHFLELGTKRPGARLLSQSPVGLHGVHGECEGVRRVRAVQPLPEPLQRVRRPELRPAAEVPPRRARWHLRLPGSPPATSLGSACRVIFAFEKQILIMI
jgi:hypothetical protein